MKVNVTDHTISSVLEAFKKNFSDREEIGASISLFQDGKPVLNEAAGAMSRGGAAWTTETLVPVYSATKGPASATLLYLLEKYDLGLESRVCEVWPEFPYSEATFAHLLSHQCGMPALDASVEVRDYSAVIRALESQKPAWELGQGHGYHPRTFGFLLDESVRRLEGRTLGEVWNADIRQALGIDFWIGLPESEWSRVATLYTGKAKPVELQEDFYRAFNTAGTLSRQAFWSPRGLHSVSEMNASDAWSLALPAMGGVGTASALAQFYQACLGKGESPIFSEKVRSWMNRPLVSGHDQVLLRPTSFAAGFMMDPLGPTGRKLRYLFGPSRGAFGHPGAGGGHAFADPESGLSFAYTMNQMELSVLPGKKSLDMVRAIYAG